MGGQSEQVVRFEVLGPLRATRGGVALNLGPVQQQVVLAVLLLHANRAVGRDELITGVWGAQIPTYAVNLVQKHVSALRHVLASSPSTRQLAELVWTRAGYQLSLPERALDLELFEWHAEQARQARLRGDLQATDEELRAAMRLWRGPLCDGLVSPLVESERERLAERHLGIWEKRLEVDLAQSRHAEVISELRQLAGRFPLRERLHELLMLALYRSGRRAEALAVFRDARRRLKDELGIEPSTPLQQLQQQVLTGDPALEPAAADDGPGATVNEPRPTLPSQLPHGLAGFAGRRAELNQLHRTLLEDPRNEGDEPVVITAIDGTAGVGKTALALQWAHRIRDRYPDGQLYINLRGFDRSGAAMEPGEAIRAFLDAFGVPHQRIPIGLEAQAALYRSLLAGKRVLVVLDNARDAEQVRPLLPGSPGCLAVVTSRNRLHSLVVTEGAHTVSVGLLAMAEARELLIARLGRSRVAAEPAAADEIIASCARLPLALAIVAARAATRPQFPLSGLADQLRETRDRLDAFDDDSDVAGDVRAVFSWSYRALSDPAARLFRLLGLHPGPHVTVAAAASAAGRPRRDAGRALSELTRANMIGEPGPGRFVFHDLLRVYAGELALEQESEDDRRAAVQRMLDHHLHTAHCADRLLNPHRDPLPLNEPPSGVTTEGLADHERALAWFAAEHPALLSATDLASASGFDRHAWQLPWSMATFFDRRGHWHDQVAIQHVALAAMQRVAEPAFAAQAHLCLARAYSTLGRYGDAHAHLNQATTAYERTGDPVGRGHADLTLARVLYRQGRHAEALNHAEEALELYRSRLHRAGQAAALNAIGWFCALLNDHEKALVYCEEALALHAHLGDAYGEAAAWDSLGYAHSHLFHNERAVRCYLHATDLWRRLGDRFNEADTLGRLGDTFQAMGATTEARAAWQQAQDIFEDLHHPEADEIRSKLSRATAVTCA
ncbi:AfsR/SARP family transcriptional regulator [Paractinoplanes globisporus]|uniref:BTAD domain-containing putative transcriptional regulator n=1 Tax=Paractinoplanes globisporus TaxID=113565 RepID=A0ABW6WNA0_9ACTN|nr:BTAD domain-containing putative transcriptional regulator [Actinoplanes globisporus]